MLDEGRCLSIGFLLFDFCFGVFSLFGFSMVVFVVFRSFLGFSSLFMSFLRVVCFIDWFPDHLEALRCLTSSSSSCRRCLAPENIKFC